MLRHAVQLGCQVVEPAGAKDSYLNVRPPSISSRRGRVAAIHVRTGSLEFQNGSWTRLLQSDGFRRVASGDKAAVTLDSDEAVQAAVKAFDHEATW